MKALRYLLLFLILAVAITRISVGFVMVRASSIDSTSLMEKINQERKNRNIGTLATSQKLNRAAEGKTQDMFSRSYFDHVDPDGSYVWPRIEAEGYKPYKQLGENLAMDFSTEDGIVKAWINSPSHRDNMLKSDFEDQGLSSQYGTYSDRYTNIVTSLFGTLIAQTPAPTSPPPAPSATPKAPTPTPTKKPTPTKRPVLPTATPIPPSPTPSPPPASPTPTPEPLAPTSTTAPSEPSNIASTTESTPAKPDNNGDNKPAIQIYPRYDTASTSSASSTAPSFLIGTLSQLTSSEINFYEMLRIIFIILVMTLVSTIAADSFIHRDKKNKWRPTTAPMMFIIFLACLLTIFLY